MEKLLNEKQTAKLFGKSVHTLRNDRHCRRGIPYIKIGRSVRYSLGDIQEYIKSKRVDPGARA